MKIIFDHCDACITLKGAQPDPHPSDGEAGSFRQPMGCLVYFKEYEMKQLKLILLGIVALALLLPALAQANQNSQGQSEQQAPQGRRHQRGGKIFKRMDKNNDRQISRDEWSRKPKAFDKLDRNGDGFLNEEEIKEAGKQRRNQQNPTQPPAL
jgi:hypothetical protein